jgi:uncharacterized protein YhaN
VKISGWHIEGFGVFQGFDVRLSDGLTVFLGPNEAGKSTLLGFLRAMLFGFPGRRSKALSYPPLQGGRHGGRLILDGPGGEVVVERFAGRKNTLVVNGREAAQQELDPLLGGADGNLFSSVFAFSLSEMQSFEWIEAEQIRDRIFSAGIAGAGASARRVIDTLGAEASAILRPRGTSLLRDLTARIDQAERNLEAAQAEAERYVELEQELETRAAQVAALSTEEAGMLRRQHAFESALEVWSECDRARQELAGLDDAREFPSEPEARLASLASGAAAARAAVRRIEEERGAKEQLRAQLAVDGHLAEIADGVEKLNAEIGPHLDRLQALAALRARKSRNALWMALGVAIVYAEVALAGRNGIAAAIAALLVSLVAAGFLLFERSARRAQIARLEHEIGGWEEPVRKWLASSSAGETLRLEFLDLRTRCERNREMLIKAAGLDEALTESGARLESARRRLNEAEAALNAFLREAGADDEAQFEARLRAFRRRQELCALIRDRESRIGEPAGNPMEWAGELRRLEEKLRETRQERDAAVGAQRLADAERRRIAGSDSTPAIRAEIECLRSELAAAVREWRIVTLSRELVARTLQEFTRTRQPAVLAEASAAFARITEGRYERILQDEDGESLVVAGRRGERKRPEELSRGTAEQLYLCIRLGLASEFTRRSVSLPIIMDDVLVNFDPARARAVAQELSRFSVGRQILIFTCHPETARLFMEAAPEAQVVRLPRQGESRQHESVAED